VCIADWYWGADKISSLGLLRCARVSHTPVSDAINSQLCVCKTVCLSVRLVLRCRQDARSRFAKMRSDVLVKLELLDNKHGS